MLQNYCLLSILIPTFSMTVFLDDCLVLRSKDEKAYKLNGNVNQLSQITRKESEIATAPYKRMRAKPKQIQQACSMAVHVVIDWQFPW
jgi:hypothetical protein